MRLCVILFTYKGSIAVKVDVTPNDFHDDWQHNELSNMRF